MFYLQTFALGKCKNANVSSFFWFNSGLKVYKSKLILSYEAKVGAYQIIFLLKAFQFVDGTLFINVRLFSVQEKKLTPGKSAFVILIEV